MTVYREFAGVGGTKEVPNTRMAIPTDPSIEERGRGKAKKMNG